jgi:FtsH-binding integral membrane protein
MPRHLIDQMPSWALVAAMIVIFVAVNELGFRMGRRRRADAERRTQATTILAALLTLLGLMLAFTFTVVQTRFLARKQLVVQEANAIGTAYLRAAMLPDGAASRSQELLREYVELRIVRDPGQVAAAVQESEKFHDVLWAQAERVAERNPESEVVSLYVRALNEVIDLHTERVAVGVYHRLAPLILGILFVIAVFAMSTLGHSSGLSRWRGLVPTFSVIIGFSCVLLLIIEMDRPWQRVFPVNQEALKDLQETVNARP